jgi:hypothetical protein
MLEAAIRRVDEGQPPLLGLRWVPSEVKLVRTVPEGSGRSRPGLRSHRGHGAHSAQASSELDRRVERLKEEARKKDRQIRWLQELAIDAAEAPIPRIVVRETERLRQHRALARWRAARRGLRPRASHRS